METFVLITVLFGVAGIYAFRRIRKGATEMAGLMSLGESATARS